MIVERTFYEPSTGRVMGAIRGTEDDVGLNLQAGWETAEGLADRSTQYVVNGEIVPRPAMPVTQNGLTLSVPPGTEFFVAGPANAHGVAVDGELSFEFVEPGEYRVRLVNFPYRDAEVTLEG
jgi:hypothetical protein